MEILWSETVCSSTGFSIAYGIFAVLMTLITIFACYDSAPTKIIVSMVIISSVLWGAFVCSLIFPEIITYVYAKITDDPYKELCTKYQFVELQEDVFKLKLLPQ